MDRYAQVLTCGCWRAWSISDVLGKHPRNHRKPWNYCARHRASDKRIYYFTGFSRRHKLPCVWRSHGDQVQLLQRAPLAANPAVTVSRYAISLADVHMHAWTPSESTMVLFSELGDAPSFQYGDGSSEYQIVTLDDEIDCEIDNTHEPIDDRGQREIDFDQQCVVDCPHMSTLRAVFGADTRLSANTLPASRFSLAHLENLRKTLLCNPGNEPYLDSWALAVHLVAQQVLPSTTVHCEHTFDWIRECGALIYAVGYTDNPLHYEHARLLGKLLPRELVNLVQLFQCTYVVKGIKCDGRVLLLPGQRFYVDYVCANILPRSDTRTPTRVHRGHA